MDDVVLLTKSQRLQDLLSEDSHQVETKPFVVIPFDQVIQVNTENLELDAEMVTEDEIVKHLNDPRSLTTGRIVQHPDLNKSLLEESRLVLDDFDATVFFGLMVKALDRLSKGPSTKVVDHLVAIRDVVLQDHLVVSFPIIETLSVQRPRPRPNLLFQLRSNIIDFRVFIDLHLLILC